MPDAALLPKGQLEIVEHGQVLEPGGLLELAADAEIGDRGLVEPGQIDLAVEHHVAGIGSGLAAGSGLA